MIRVRVHRHADSAPPARHLIITSRVLGRHCIVSDKCEIRIRASLQRCRKLSKRPAFRRWGGSVSSGSQCGSVVCACRGAHILRDLIDVGQTQPTPIGARSRPFDRCLISLSPATKVFAPRVCHYARPFPFAPYSRLGDDGGKSRTLHQRRLCVSGGARTGAPRPGLAEGLFGDARKRQRGVCKNAHLHS